MNKNAKFATIAIIVLVAIVALAVWKAKPDNTPKVGVILATSGGAAFIGEPEKAVLKELISQGPYAELSNGVGKIEFVFKDSGGSADQALQYLEEFSEDPSVIAVIGPSTSGEGIPMAKRAYEYRIPMLALAASSSIVLHPDDPDRANPWVYKFAQNDDLAAQRLINVITTKSAKPRIAFLHSDDGFGKSGNAVFQSSVKEDPRIEIVYTKGFPAKLTTPESVLNDLPDEIDGIVIWGTSPVALLVRALKKTENPTQIYLSHGNASADFVKAVGVSGEGVIIVGSRVLLPQKELDKNDKQDAVVQQFQDFWNTRKSSFRGPPSHFAGHARDALDALQVAITQHGTGFPNRSALRAQLEAIGELPGVTGTFRFTKEDHAGLDLSAFEVYEIHAGGFKKYRSN